LREGERQREGDAPATLGPRFDQPPWFGLSLGFHADVEIPRAGDAGTGIHRS